MKFATMLRPALSALVMLLVLAAAGCSWKINVNQFGGYSFDYEGAQASRAEQGGIPPGTTRIEIDNKFGEVTVEGTDGTLSWHWDVRTWADDQATANLFLEEVRLETVQAGGVAKWVVHLPKNRKGDLNGLKSNLVLKVPPNVAVELDHGFGKATLSRIHGGSKVDVSYTDLYLRDLDGVVEVETSFGFLDAEDLPGGSRLENSYGPITVRRVRGHLVVDNDFEKIFVEDAPGGVEATNSYGPVTLLDVGGRVTVENSFSNVTISGNPAEVSCDNSYGTVTLNLQGTGTSRITVDNSFGDIMVEIPAGTEARVEASTSYGVVKSEIRGPGVQTTSSGTDFRSGPTDARMQITLNTSYGDIEVRSAGN